MAEIKLYIDTSALLKCYVAEKNSDKVENFLASRFDGTKSCLVLSRLSTLEWHCAMRRRERAGDFDASYRQMATAAFQDRIAAGYYEMLRLENALYGKALALLEKIVSPLRSLDAMHLAIAHSAGITELVTADKVMAEAAKELGLKTHFFA